MIKIFTEASPGLYRSLQDSIHAVQSTHRTASGAVRGLRKMLRRSERWGTAMGRWGHIRMSIDGRRIASDELGYLISLIEDAGDHYPTSPVERIQAMINGMTAAK